MKNWRRAGEVGSNGGSDGGTAVATQRVGLGILVFGFWELNIVWGVAGF